MGREFNEGDDGDDRGTPRYPKCEGCNCVITNEQVDGSSFTFRGKTYFITYRCVQCTELEFARIVKEDS